MISLLTKIVKKEYKGSYYTLSRRLFREMRIFFESIETNTFDGSLLALRLGSDLLGHSRIGF
jgi:hypothetical protein